MPDLYSIDDWEGKIIENIDLKYLSNRASFRGSPVFSLRPKPEARGTFRQQNMMSE